MQKSPRSYSIQTPELRAHRAHELGPKNNFSHTLPGNSGPWVEMLPLALLWACHTPRPSGYSPFEILYGRPPPIISRLGGDL